MATDRKRSLTRRTMLQGAGGVASAALLSALPVGDAEAATARTRHDIKTPQGKVALDLYREAVAKMKALPEGNPLSWNFQANIHAHTHSQAEALALFNQPGVTPAMRALALGPNGDGKGGVWWTCSHFHSNFDGSDADDYAPHFTSWHRLYVWHFERVCEKVLGKPFALPYWNYLDLTQLKPPQAVLAQRVRVKGQLVDNALYHEDRRPEFVTEGLRAIKADLANTDILARDTMRTKNFFDVSTSNGGSRQGFISALDGTPHGSVHVRIGTDEGGGMSDVTTASRDPIFWLHHNNIDRLWESWRAPNTAGASLKDPKAPKAANWLNKTFTFAGADGLASTKNAASTLSLPKLGYRFDRLQPIGSIAFLAPNAETTVMKVTTVSQSAAGAGGVVAPGNKPVVMTLTPALADSAVKALARDGGNQFWLVIDVATPKNPRSLFEVQVRAKKSATGTAEEQRTVQTFNLFNAGMHERHGTGYKTTWQVDVSELVRSSKLDLTKPVEITVKPVGGESGGLVKISAMRIEVQ
jgi:tyrosinase